LAQAIGLDVQRRPVIALAHLCVLRQAEQEQWQLVLLAGLGRRLLGISVN
jgi:hypothetical protein